MRDDDKPSPQYQLPEALRAATERLPESEWHIRGLMKMAADRLATLEGRLVAPSHVGTSESETWQAYMRVKAALDRSAYALFQLKRFADMPNAAIEFCIDQHAEACKVLDDLSAPSSIGATEALRRIDHCSRHYKTEWPVWDEATRIAALGAIARDSLAAPSATQRSTEEENKALRAAWLTLRQRELVHNGMKIEQARIHAETELASGIAALKATDGKANNG